MFNKNKRFLLASIIFVILALGINGFIIYQSCLNSSESTSWSSPVITTAADLINTIKPDTITEENFPSFATFIRKFIGHFSLFLCSGVLTTLAIYFSSSETLFIKKYKGIFSSIFIGLFLAFLTEIIQLFTNGRSGEITDSLIDFTGYIIGFGIIFLITFLIKKKAATSLN